MRVEDKHGISVSVQVGKCVLMDTTDKIEKKPTKGYKPQKWSKKCAQNDTDLGCFAHKMTRGTVKGVVIFQCQSW